MNNAAATVLFVLACAAAAFSGCATSAVHKAALAGDTRTVLQRPTSEWVSDSLCRSSLRTTALGCAVAGGHLETVRAMLDAGAQPNQPSSMSALGLSIGNPQILRVLLERGADPNARDAVLCPLHWAVAARSLESLRLLLDAGADPSCKDGHLGYRKTVMQWAEGTAFFHSWPEGERVLREATNPELRAKRAEGSIRQARAAREGAAAKALSAYVEAYRYSPEGHASRDRILEKLFDVARLMSTPAAIPAEAHEHADLADSMIRQAKDELGFAKAAAHLRQAIDVAPWWAEAYFNLGLTLEKTGDLAGASRALTLFLKAALEARERDEVRRKLLDLRAALELRRGN